MIYNYNVVVGVFCKGRAGVNGLSGLLSVLRLDELDL